MPDSEVEVYRQRYETFRHFDKLRWQMLQLLVAVASATAVVLRSTEGAVEWWFFSLLGFALLLISFVMFKISAGIRRNSEVLRHAAETVGDRRIPDVSNPWRSVAHWLALAVCVVGGALLISSIFLATGAVGCQ